MENTRTAFDESWAPQVRKARLILLGLLAVALWLAITAWSADDSAGTFIGAAVIGGFGLLGLLSLSRSGDTGLRIDATGVTVRLPKGPVTFRWDETDAVLFHIRHHTGPGRSPRSWRTNTHLRLRLAPVGEFADRPGLAPMRLHGEEPYTHQIKVITSGPFTHSDERMVHIDAALRTFAGSRYAGVDRNVRWRPDRPAG